MLKILYFDDDLVAVHKLSGLMVHKSRITDDKTFLLQQLRDQIKKLVYPVHRLDRRRLELCYLLCILMLRLKHVICLGFVK